MQMRMWTRCARIPLFWKKPRDEAPMRYAPGWANERDRSPLSREARRRSRPMLSSNPPCAVAHHREKQRRSRTLYGALYTRQESHGWRHRPHSIRRQFVGRMLVLAGMASSRHRCRDRSGRLSSRTLQPAGSSTGARSWPSSGQEIRWRQCRGCA